MWPYFLFALLGMGVGGILYNRRKKKLAQKAKPLQMAKSANNLTACINVLQNLSYMENFAPDIHQCLEQIARYTHKIETIKEILLQKFSPDEMSFGKFIAVLQGVEGVVYANLRSIINKISAFDYDEYSKIKELAFSRDDLAKEKMDIYRSYMDYVDHATKDNEEILLKLDRLLLEISHYTDMGTGDIMNMPAMLALDALIQNAKRYANN